MMLGIDLRKTKPNSVSAAIKQYISITYDEDPTAYTEDLNQFEKLRNDIINLPICDNSVNVLYKYYGQLIFLCAKFPLEDNKITCVFSWTPSFGKDKRHVNISSIEYEKACVLFNIGAMYSNVGTKENLDNADDIKNACIYFQRAAGIFTYLKEELHGSLKCPVPPDMLPNSLDFLIKLMLAQAQECFWKKAVLSKMKNNTIAKLAKAASNLYGEAYKVGNNNNLISQEWISYVLSKMYYLESACLIRYAMINYDNCKYGDQISCLMEAERLMLKCKSFKNQLPEDYYEDLKSFTKYISGRVKEEDYNNNKIYMDIVPDFAKLQPIDGAAMVKPIPIPDQKSLENIVGKPLFDCLIPFNYHEITVNYNTNKEQLVSNLISKLKTESQVFEDKVASLNINASIDALDQTHGLPQSVIDRSNIVIRKGGLKSIQETFSKASAISQENQSIIDKLKNDLNEEENDDLAARNQFGERWTRETSRNLNRGLMEKLRNYEEKVNQAITSDSIVQAKIDQNIVGIEALSSTKEELEASIPACRANASLNIQNNPEVIGLKEKMNQFEQSMEQKQSIIKNLNEKCKNDSINNIVLMLITNKEEINKEKIVGEQLQKYTTDKGIITDYLEGLKNLTNEIVELNSVFVLKKYKDNLLTERENALKNLEDSYKVYEEICMNLEEGINFHSRINSLLKQLSGNISDFIFARKLDMKERVNDLTQNISTGNLMDTTGYGISSPPPLPPRIGAKDKDIQNNNASAYPTANYPPSNYQNYGYGYPNQAPPPQAYYPYPPSSNPGYYQGGPK
ncbi:BRO1-domain-containing protein [Piromyces finnis]|uniref:BRO1-domain-containing protein n=1 Tax=Piromyces finnis TaxID=1754191 RepID=A0A1Y1UYX7_9FUNG|nr:BRO1-domain-containing protein [Piromyces finnis]|eukprot:ORX43624.1 BRO1-domain-containing protein [Piromyces finnis]